MWWLHTVISQTQEAVDPLSLLLKSSNPSVVAVGSVLALLFGADKVAFWINKFKSQQQATAPDCSPEVKKNIEALVDAQHDLAQTLKETAKTVERFADYSQRHFESTSLEMRSVREELRAIRERFGSNAHGKGPG